MRELLCEGGHIRSSRGAGFPCRARVSDKVEGFHITRTIIDSEVVADCAATVPLANT